VPLFTQSQLQAIADALADTSQGLIVREIAHLLITCRMTDPSPGMTKRYRLYNAFAKEQNKNQDRRAILAFIRKSMKPERYARDPERYEPLRANLNRALAFAGLAVTSSGELVPGQTGSDANRGSAPCGRTSNRFDRSKRPPGCTSIL
jgi:hypothetical protein